LILLPEDNLDKDLLKLFCVLFSWLYEFNAATFVLILIIYSSLKFCVVPGILASSSNLFWLYEHLSSNTSADSVASNGVLVTITTMVFFKP
jgi:hypothetical protein